MEKKLIKLFIDGLEYALTDKEAQQILDVLSGRVDKLEKEVADMQDPAYWWKTID